MIQVISLILKKGRIYSIFRG